jgi:DNA primase large subunit
MMYCAIKAFVEYQGSAGEYNYYEDILESNRKAKLMAYSLVKLAEGILRKLGAREIEEFVPLVEVGGILEEEDLDNLENKAKAEPDDEAVKLLSHEEIVNFRLSFLFTLYEAETRKEKNMIVDRIAEVAIRIIRKTLRLEQPIVLLVEKQQLPWIPAPEGTSFISGDKVVIIEKMIYSSFSRVPPSASVDVRFRSLREMLSRREMLGAKFDDYTQP